jgi:arabinoxylan arabinofuranohydrolase
MKYLICIILFGSIIYTSSAQNPIITNMYTADPSARVFKDTLYLYPSHDRDSAKWWDMIDWHVFSTVDMKHWKDHGVALSLKDIKWAKKYAWAPDCGFKNGRYYFYYPTDQDFIGVAISNAPAGPFTDPLGKPLITRQTPGVIADRDLIDPCIFTDDDGTSYLFFGQNNVCAVTLNKDMISFNSPATIIKGTDHFFEAIWVHKYNGKYYMSYSGDGKILYSMADKVLGPYEFKGEILDKVNSGTNHHSIVQYKGNWYLFYHNSDLALKNIPPDSPDREFIQWRRSVCIEYLHYNADGTIQKVTQTKEGVSEIPGINSAK